MNTIMYLDAADNGELRYSCEIDGVLSWESLIPDDEHLLSRLNGSYDTFDRRAGLWLSREDYPSALAAEVDGDVSTVSASWWKRVLRIGG